LRSLVSEVTLVADIGALAIILRGDLGAILRFAAGRKVPGFLSESEALDNLLSPDSLVAGTRNRRSLRSGAQNAKTSAAELAEVSQLSLVAGTGFEPVTFRL
jgi:site-specific DNA recombinase